MIKNKSFQWFDNKQSLSEIYQSIEMKFSLAGEEDGVIKQAHPWVKCRDFLHDALRSQLTGIESAIFGFKFTPNTAQFPKISLDRTLLLISQQTINDAKTYRADLSKALSFIHYYENLAGVKNSTLKKVPLHFCKDKTAFKHVWLFEGSTFWISAPYMISMLTFLLRLGCKLPKMTAVTEPEKVYKEIVDKYEKEWEELTKSRKSFRKDNDVIYLQTCGDKLGVLVTLKDSLLKVHGTDTFSTMYDKSIPISTFHDQTGILNACRGTTWNKKFNEIIKGATK